jgi:hypothetical protein
VKTPRTTERMLDALELERWQREDGAISEHFGIKGKKTCREIPLETMEALVADVQEYIKIWRSQ